MVSAVVPPRAGWGFQFTTTQPEQTPASPTPPDRTSSKRKMTRSDMSDDSDDDKPQRRRGPSTDMDLFSTSFQQRLSTRPHSSPSSPFASSSSSAYSKVAKRARHHHSITSSARPLPLDRLLESLDQKGLRSVLESLCQAHPALVPEVIQLAPRLTVPVAVDSLRAQLGRISQSMPFQGDQRGDYAFLRVRSGVDEFLRAMADYLGHFLPPSEPQLTTTLEYLDAATELLHQLPEWTNPINNHHRNDMYEELCAAWNTTIREAAKRAGGLGLAREGWQHKLEAHNSKSGGRLDAALDGLRQELAWLGEEQVASTPERLSFAVSPAPAAPLWT